jgi:small nuclear ribonucleoprotein (snRNP)-like protein
LNYVLKSNNLLHLINKGDVNVTLEKFDVNCKKLNSYLHRQIKKEKRKPYSKGSSYIVDSSSQILYKQTPNGLCCFLSTTKRRERVLIKLSNNIEYKGDIRIVLKNDTIELHKAITTKFNTNDNSSITGLYIDFNDLFTTQNKIYGKNFSKLLKKFTHTIHLK